MSAYIRWFEDVDSGDVATVGGKNASLGEMIRNLKSKGIRVPEGFAVTAQAYRAFLDAHGLTDKIARRLTGWSGDTESLRRTGADIRDTILREEFPKELNEAIVDAYRKLSGRYGLNEADVAVRSSATAEDLPDASFAGQQDTFLNITGEAELLTAVRRCFASLFTDRAISYRTEKGFDHSEVSISVGVQKMVRSDVASAGVMFTIDTETGFPHIVM
ncbi:MAG TPA: PEP/pyruvate-binding domain-containing protein, partial [bacterium]|nr:PEP/pyruvate-binding domain-containing protein [bacterium]